MNTERQLLTALSTAENRRTKAILISTITVLITLGMLLFSGCKKDKSMPSSSSGDKTTFNMRMTDAPGDYDAVYIEVVGAEVHSDVDGWVTLNVKPGIYNLLDLTNGKDTLIASGQIAVGTVSQIRLILGDNNSVVVDSLSYHLTTPSAQQSGLKLDVHAELIKGVTYNMVIDFDAAKSIVAAGKERKYILKPVLRVITKALDGAIKGTITPVAAQPAVYAISGTDSFSTYANVSTGAFFIGGLKTGSYKVVILPKTPYSDTAISGVGVTLGAVTDMGMITLK